MAGSHPPCPWRHGLTRVDARAARCVCAVDSPRLAGDGGFQVTLPPAEGSDRDLARSRWWLLSIADQCPVPGTPGCRKLGSVETRLREARAPAARWLTALCVSRSGVIRIGVRPRQSGSITRTTRRWPMGRGRSPIFGVRLVLAEAAVVNRRRPHGLIQSRCRAFSLLRPLLRTGTRHVEYQRRDTLSLERIRVMSMAAISW